MAGHPASDAIGVVLWFVAALVNRATGQTAADPDMETIGTRGPVN